MIHDISSSFTLGRKSYEPQPIKRSFGLENNKVPPATPGNYTEASLEDGIGKAGLAGFPLRTLAEDTPVVITISYATMVRRIYG